MARLADARAAQRASGQRIVGGYGDAVITLESLDAVSDEGAVVSFMTSNDFPFHVGGRPTCEEMLRRLSTDGWTHAWWVVADRGERIGVARLEDVGAEVDPEETPMFDLRLSGRARGRGLGRQALEALTAHVFTTFPVRRFEGCTREDNIAMRRVFLACGWVKEAHYREAWPVPGGDALDAVNYGILRRDWAGGYTTPVRFDDLT